MLYQKYKPLNYKDVVGQDRIVKELYTRSKNNDFPSVVYLTGDSGIGKTVLAQLIGKSILCEDLQEGNPCNKCLQCNAINNEETNVNYFEYNASNIGIDEMRQIEENSKKKNSFSKNQKKVFYIDELQEMAVKSKSASTNLLKLLERPTKNNYFILGSMNDEKINEAIKSRGIKYYLKNLEPMDIARRLGFIYEQEVGDLDESQANIILAIAHKSGGSLRKGISYLERVIYSEIKTEEDALEELNLLTTQKLSAIINGLCLGQPSILSHKFTNEVFSEIMNNLNMFYKFKLGVYLHNWEKNKLQGINSSITVKQIQKVYSCLLPLYTLPYLNNHIIQSHLLQLFNSTSGTPRPARKPRG